MPPPPVTLPLITTPLLNAKSSSAVPPVRLSIFVKSITVLDTGVRLPSLVDVTAQALSIFGPTILSAVVTVPVTVMLLALKTVPLRVTVSAPSSLTSGLIATVPSALSAPTIPRSAKLIPPFELIVILAAAPATPDTPGKPAPPTILPTVSSASLSCVSETSPALPPFAGLPAALPPVVVISPINTVAPVPEIVTAPAF